MELSILGRDNSDDKDEDKQYYVDWNLVIL